MVVLVGFRRARFFHRFATTLLGWVPGVSRWLSNHRSWLGPNVWYVTALFFTQPCSGKHCKWCAKRKSSLPPHVPGAAHVVKMTSVSEPEFEGVCATIDCPLDKPEAWVFVELRNVAESASLKFWKEEGEKGYNHRGAVLSQLGVCSRGVQRDLDTSRVNSFFCTELVATFVQRSQDYGLTPCNTNASELFRCMLQRGPNVYVYATKEDGENNVFQQNCLRPLPVAVGGESLV